MDGSYYYSSTAAGLGAGLTIGLVIVSLLVSLISIVAMVLFIIAQWKLFQKAGQHGWAALIPFYSIWVTCDILFNNNVMWFIFYLIPPLNTVAMIAVFIATAKSFGKGVGYGILSIFFFYITWPILGFGKAEYIGKAF